MQILRHDMITVRKLWYITGPSKLTSVSLERPVHACPLDVKSVPPTYCALPAGQRRRAKHFDFFSSDVVRRRVSADSRWSPRPQPQPDELLR